MTDLAIRVESLGKRYRLGERERYSALRDLPGRVLGSALRRLAFRDPKSTAPQSASHNSRDIWALHDLSFEINRGEVVGVIGRNGAGKSTLLKILSRITEPTKGRVEIHGRVGSLLEVGTGFHPELTGRENIYFNGAILGMKKAETARKFDEIVAFAEVEHFIDTPVKHYSTGMQMRLAFSVAAHLDTDIMIVDEVLAVGDRAFQDKCLGRMHDLPHSGRTILFVSHQLAHIRHLCTVTLWLSAGRLRDFGSTATTVASYESSMLNPTDTPNAIVSNPFSHQTVMFLGWELLTSEGNTPHILTKPGPVTFRIRLELKHRIARGYYLIHLRDSTGAFLWSLTKSGLMLDAGRYDVVHTLPILPLRPGAYFWDVRIHDGERWIEPWFALPNLVIHTPEAPHLKEEYAGILNLPSTTTFHKLA